MKKVKTLKSTVIEESINSMDMETLCSMSRVTAAAIRRKQQAESDAKIEKIISTLTDYDLYEDILQQVTNVNVYSSNGSFCLNHRHYICFRKHLIELVIVDDDDNLLFRGYYYDNEDNPSIQCNRLDPLDEDQSMVATLRRYLEFGRWARKICRENGL
jgi:hypothetical protein